VVWSDVDGSPINAHGAGMLFFGGTYYWYVEIKTGTTTLPPYNASWGGTRVDVVGVSCYSSTDLLGWHLEGNVLPANVADPTSPLYSGKVLERPKVIYNAQTAKFVMWMHLDTADYQAGLAGVAVADAPTGPFALVSATRPNGEVSRDLTIFQDDDGSAYLFHASQSDNSTMEIAPLSSDYLSPQSTFASVFVGESWEAPAVFKRQGRYYLVASGSTGWAPNAAHSAVADAPLGPWTELGNPAVGPGAQNTFASQSAYVFPVAGRLDAYIFMADRWDKWDLASSRYLWLPVTFTPTGFDLAWTPSWDLSVFR
jgi:hypothetical protein